MTNQQKRYLELTTNTLPALAKSTHTHWPVSEDHCFARIVLDNICQDVWYNELTAPAYQSMSEEQLSKAIMLCEDIIDARADLYALNQHSLNWREAHKKAQGKFDF